MGSGSGSPAEVVISVRGEATETVDPDVAVITLGLSATSPTKVDASVEVGRLQVALLETLAAVGGVARTAATEDASVTWSTPSISTHPAFEHDPRTGRMGRTDRWTANALVELRVRDVTRLEELQAALDLHDQVQVHQVGWLVDRENPAWPQIRAAAIADAIGRGRDYARALGGTLARIDHVADAGLLGGTTFGPATRGVASRPAAAGSPGAPAPAPARLDPVPQVLSAVIEARLVASGVRLPEG